MERGGLDLKISIASLEGSDKQLTRAALSACIIWARYSAALAVVGAQTGSVGLMAYSLARYLHLLAARCKLLHRTRIYDLR